jgi:hypothetical protein
LCFKALVEEKKAAKPLENLEAEVEATNLFGSLRTKKGDKFTYDTVKLNAILSIYNEGGGLGPEDYNQKLACLLPHFKSNPLRFLDNYNKAIEQYEVAIKTGVKLNVITIASKEAKIKIGTETRMVLTFTKESKDENIEALIYHFMTAGVGANDYNEVVSEIEKKKIEALK